MTEDGKWASPVNGFDLERLGNDFKIKPRIVRYKNKVEYELGQNSEE